MVRSCRVLLIKGPDSIFSFANSARDEEAAEFPPPYDAIAERIPFDDAGCQKKWYSLRRA
jgi:hypothetical protein